MAAAIWDQSDFNKNSILNLGGLVRGVDFALNEKTSLSSASVWLADGFDTPNDGQLNNFSGQISWAIFTNSNVNGPGLLLDSGSGIGVTQTDTGMDFQSMDIVRVDFSFGASPLIMQGPDNYWFAIREGDWTEAYDGSEIWWNQTLAVQGQKGWYTPNEVTPEDGWVDEQFGDSAFMLWDERPGATNDTVTTLEGAAVPISFLANDVFDPTSASVTFTSASYGTVTRNENATPADISDDTFGYKPNANFHGTDSFTYTLTIGNWTETATVNITVTPVNEAPPNAVPRFSGPSELSIGENQFAIAALAATDPDGDALSYSIVGGDDATLFSIDAKTGMLSFLRAPDFETPGSAAGSNEYQVRVEVSDGSRHASKLFQVSVTDSDDEIVGTAGNDVFHAGAAFEHFHGDAGRDTVVFKGSHDDYAINVLPDGRITVGHGNGIDTLDSIERLQFDDGTLAFDAEGTAGQMFRLYQAVFGREPDPEGLGYWVHHQDTGQSSFQDVARSFMASPEFEQRYGDEDALSNTTFIDLLYQNVLGRDPDADGFAYWVDKLDTGQTNFGDLLAFFSDSKENIASTADAVSDGIWLL